MHQKSSFSYSTFTVLLVLSIVLAVGYFQFKDYTPETKTEKVPEDPYNGLRTRYRDDGTLLAEVTYKDSIRHGLARNYFRSGGLQLEMNYVEGKRHGDARSFYENGDLYQVTPFVNDQRSGVQKKYYPGHILMAEVTFKDNEQLPGIKEYNKEGRIISKNAEIVFRLEDKTAFENKYELFFSLSDKSPNARFNKCFIDAGGKVQTQYAIATTDGIASLEFFLLPGQRHMEQIIITGERQTRLGNRELFQGTYNLAIENRKRVLD